LVISGDEDDVYPDEYEDDMEEAESVLVMASCDCFASSCGVADDPFGSEVGGEDKVVSGVCRCGWSSICICPVLLRLADVSGMVLSLVLLVVVDAAATPAPVVAEEVFTLVLEASLVFCSDFIT